MTNVVKFPRREDSKNQQSQRITGQESENTMSNIIHGIVGALYMVMAIIWIPIRFLLIANVVIQFFKMLFKWSSGPFSAAWPFVISFLILTALTYIMANWKPKAP